MLFGFDSNLKKEIEQNAQTERMLRTSLHVEPSFLNGENFWDDPALGKHLNQLSYALQKGVGNLFLWGECFDSYDKLNAFLANASKENKVPLSLSLDFHSLKDFPCGKDLRQDFSKKSQKEVSGIFKSIGESLWAEGIKVNMMYFDFGVFSPFKEMPKFLHMGISEGLLSAGIIPVYSIENIDLYKQFLSEHKKDLFTAGIWVGDVVSDISDVILAFQKSNIIRNYNNPNSIISGHFSKDVPFENFPSVDALAIEIVKLSMDLVIVRDSRHLASFTPGYIKQLAGMKEEFVHVLDKIDGYYPEGNTRMRNLRDNLFFKK